MTDHANDHVTGHVTDHVTDHVIGHVTCILMDTYSSSGWGQEGTQRYAGTGF